MQLLLDFGAPHDLANDQGDTALHLAAAAGHLPQVKALLQSLCEVDAQNSKGNTPLWLAAEGGHIHILHLLLQFGA